MGMQSVHIDPSGNPQSRAHMELQPLVDQIAKAIAFVDEAAAADLEVLRHQFVELRAAAAEDGLTGVSDSCDLGIEAVSELMGEPEEPSPWIALLGEIAGYASQVMDALDLELPPDSVPLPQVQQEAPASESEVAPEEAPDIDPELIEMFVGSSGDNVNELEECFLAMEAADDAASQEEHFGQIKRSLHTIKGECGVIPLPGAQVLCHHAEDLFGRFLEAGAPLPIPLLLELTDWLGAYIAQLADGDWTTVPENGELLAKLQACMPADCPDESPLFEEHDFDGGSNIAFPKAVLEDDVRSDFITEARQHLDVCEAAIRELEKRPEDPEQISVIFRAFHTLAGMAGYLNLDPVVKLAGAVETMVDQLRRGETACDKRRLELLRSSCDMMGALTGILEGHEGPEETAYAQLVASLELAISGAGVEPVAEEKAPVHEVPEVDTEESVARPRGAWRKLGEILTDQGLVSAKIVAVMLDRQKSVKGKPLGAMLVDSGLLSQGEIDAALRIQEEEKALANRHEVAPEQTPCPKDPEAAREPAVRKPRVASTIKVNTGRLDSLVDLVGELVIAQQMVYQDPVLGNLASERLSRNLAHVAKITRDMHEAAMSLRMVTLKPTFQKMARLVRDVSVKAGKQVELVLNGEDTELDRNVVEEISDPMVHLIRNAIDHGIETPDVRQVVGKRPTGRLELRAFHQGGSIVIEIVDDGAGLSRERILAKAAEQGLLPKDTDPADLPDAQVWELIFQPGFSTAAVVSDISGRGVGMDVVRRNLEKMRGKVEIVSSAGEGSVFSLRLPLTLAIIDGMIVRVGAQRYVLPTLSIEQSFRPAAEQLHEVMNKGELVKVRDMLLPIHRVRDLFGQDDGICNVQEGILIVLEDNGQRCCLMVDEILGQQQVVIKSLGEAAGLLRGISGGAILGDGRIALIVDVDGLVTRTSKAVA